MSHIVSDSAQTVWEQRKQAVLSAGSGHLISFWTFQEQAGDDRVAIGPNPYRLKEQAGPVARGDDGLFGPHRVEFDFGKWLATPRAECPALNIHGPQAQVTVAAWIRWGRSDYTGCEAVAGIWNETNRKRQYAMFLNLRIWDSFEQVGGHVSSIGGPTPGHPWCMDASIGITPVKRDEWQFVAFTYDGTYARSYLNGVLDVRETYNPYRYEGGLHDGGDDGADFTVAAVDRSGEPGNFFTGVMGGLAVYSRALTDSELLELAEATMPVSAPPTNLDSKNVQ